MSLYNDIRCSKVFRFFCPTEIPGDPLSGVYQNSFRAMLAIGAALVILAYLICPNVGLIHQVLNYVFSISVVVSWPFFIKKQYEIPGSAFRSFGILAVFTLMNFPIVLGFMKTKHFLESSPGMSAQSALAMFLLTYLIGLSAVQMVRAFLTVFYVLNGNQTPLEVKERNQRKRNERE